MKSSFESGGNVLQSGGDIFVRVTMQLWCCGLVLGIM